MRQSSSTTLFPLIPSLLLPILSLIALHTQTLASRLISAALRAHRFLPLVQPEVFVINPKDHHFPPQTPRINPYLLTEIFQNVVVPNMIHPGHPFAYRSPVFAMGAVPLFHNTVKVQLLRGSYFLSLRLRLFDCFFRYWFSLWL